jgi:hypothetical protein
MPSERSAPAGARPRMKSRPRRRRACFALRTSSSRRTSNSCLLQVRSAWRTDSSGVSCCTSTEDVPTWTMSPARSSAGRASCTSLSSTGAFGRPVSSSTPSARAMKSAPEGGGSVESARAERPSGRTERAAGGSSTRRSTAPSLTISSRHFDVRGSMAARLLDGRWSMRRWAIPCYGQAHSASAASALADRARSVTLPMDTVPRKSNRCRRSFDNRRGIQFRIEN